MSAEKVQLLALAFLPTSEYGRFHMSLWNDLWLQESYVLDALSLDTVEHWHDLESEGNADSRLKSYKPKRVWTSKFLVRYVFCNHRACFYDERKNKVKRHRKEWADSRLDALRDLAANTLR